MVWTFLFASILSFLYNPVRVIWTMRVKKISDYKLIVYSGSAYLLYISVRFPRMLREEKSEKWTRLTIRKLFLYYFLNIMYYGKLLREKEKFGPLYWHISESFYWQNNHMKIWSFYSSVKYRLAWYSLPFESWEKYTNKNYPHFFLFWLIA